MGETLEILKITARQKMTKPNFKNEFLIKFLNDDKKAEHIILI